jgi:leucyl-tRNA synthetase
MPNWAGSSWYYLRYTDPKNNKAFSDKKNLKYWTPVDWYNGGMEHTTLHLLYSRFWHKFLYDLKLVPTNEPYKKRTSHGLILASNGEKMSKSRGNVINPDSIVNSLGADSLRLYEMFMGPFSEPIAWDTNNIAGVRRFIEKVWRLQDKVIKTNSKQSSTSSSSSVSSIETLIHKTIKKVGDDIEDMKFNTAISSLMILVNELEKLENISKENYEILIRLISPFIPHIGEELWSILDNKKSVSLSSWPKYDKNKTVEDNITIVVQINGKVRSSFTISISESDDKVKEMALNMDEIKKWTEGKEIKKVIFVKGKLVNIVF